MTDPLCRVACNRRRHTVRYDVAGIGNGGTYDHSAPAGDYHRHPSVKTFVKDKTEQKRKGKLDKRSQRFYRKASRHSSEVGLQVSQNELHFDESAFPSTYFFARSNTRSII